ncbi:hypothetical protein XA68_12086 [Ophiocordyceps unilateralis]|uniref:Zinc finger CHCC-type domain-containing protein n=1 Tax=Ophiocordyceps unilateralis TaxID=268505 RepID=A0A2A9PEJ2_OPHUN|nr:hypothetical protein XA68_12086 [Ophiocordyceps unilateralis]
MADFRLRPIGLLARSLRAPQRTLSNSHHLFEAATPVKPSTETAIEHARTKELDQPKELGQAPNRVGIWSRSQKPRTTAMTGPRFEQTDMSLQPQPMSAMEMIHKQPVRWTHDRVVSCEGGGGPSGHPRIFINTDKPEIAVCNYCGLPFANEHNRKHLESLPETSYPLGCSLDGLASDCTKANAGGGLFIVTSEVKTQKVSIRIGFPISPPRTGCVLSRHVEAETRALPHNRIVMYQVPPRFQPHQSMISSGFPQPKPSMPQRTPAISTTGTFALVLLLFVALFPDLFHVLWTLPFSLLRPAQLKSSGPTLQPAAMSWFQKELKLPSKARGSYLITDEVVSALPEIRGYKIGLLNLFVQHTSCALSLNENWDEDVRADMSDAMDRIVPNNGPKGEQLYRHAAEGPDDMPAHIKTALVGASVNIPIRDGKLALGTWQGIWHLEFRTSRHSRRVMATIQGEKM